MDYKESNVAHVIAVISGVIFAIAGIVLGKAFSTYGDFNTGAMITTWIVGALQSVVWWLVGVAMARLEQIAYYTKQQSDRLQEFLEKREETK